MCIIIICRKTFCACHLCVVRTNPNASKLSAPSSAQAPINKVSASCGANAVATCLAHRTLLGNCVVMADLASAQLWRRGMRRSSMPHRLIWVKQRHLSRRRLLAKFRRSTELYSGAVEKLLGVLLVSLVSTVSYFATDYCISILLDLSSTTLGYLWLLPIWHSVIYASVFTRSFFLGM